MNKVSYIFNSQINNNGSVANLNTSLNDITILIKKMGKLNKSKKG